MAVETAPQGARARVRAELTNEIKATARRQLAEVGAAGLSLRAVARELGMVSSAVYRYFPSRDELLTALIVDAYQAVADAAAEAESGVRHSQLTQRWLAIGRAVREWAVANPQEYALIFGSPVPGYQAPADTIDPAARIPILIVGVVSDASATGSEHEIAKPSLPATVRSDLKALDATLGAGVAPHVLARGVRAWSELIGLVSFELFGHLHNVIHDYARHFDYQLRAIAVELGISG